MNPPEYYILSADMSIDPNIKEIEMGRSAVDFEIDDSPEYDDELNALLFNTTLKLEFYCYPTQFNSVDRDVDDAIGGAEVEVKVVVKGDEDEFKEFRTQWNQGGYRNTDWNFRYHVESGYLTHVIAPLSQLVGNSFRGVLPGITFTNPPDLEKIVNADRLSEIETEVIDSLRSKIVELFNEFIGDKIPEEDIDIQLNLSEGVVQVYLNEHEEELSDRQSAELADQINDFVENATRDTVEGSFVMPNLTIGIKDEPLDQSVESPG